MTTNNLTQALTIERVLSASPEQVFDAFLDPAKLVKWWGPQGFSIINCEVEAKVGGKWRIGMQSPNGSEHWIQGVYQEINLPHRLIFTWVWEKSVGVREALPLALQNENRVNPETTVTITLVGNQQQTQLRLVHEPFATKEQQLRHEKGWFDSLQALSQMLKLEDKK
jgi:uncharacterized protein YndB with AHSA1/START domain